MEAPQRRVAGMLEEGLLCPGCQEAIRAGQPLVRCPDCHHLHHEDCWTRTGRCHSYQCASASAAPRSEPADVVITAEDVARAPVTPVPPQMARPGWSGAPPPVHKRLSPLAVAAFVISILGLAFCGVPGLLAVLLGSFAVGLINSRRDLRGLPFAVAGIVIGLLGIVGWTAGLCLWYLGHGADSIPFPEPGISQPERVFGLEEGANVPPNIRRAIRANVMIVVSGRLSSYAGSGVILARDDGTVLIVTNRHVIDGAGSAPITVTFVDGTTAAAAVKWRMPAVDIALITCPAGASKFETALVARRPALETGASVFAVGNPLGLGWSYINGVISSIRRKTTDGGASQRIIQVQLPLNPGNSGGGLYEKAGALIGINTFTANRTVGEGIGFSIAISELTPLIEEHGGVRLETVPARASEKK